MIFGRKNIIVSFILLMAIALTLSPAIASTLPVKAPDQLAQTDDDDIFRIGIDIAYPPSSDLEGNARLAALGVDLMERIADDLNLEVEWVTMPTDGLFNALGAGEIDAVIVSSPISDEFEDIAQFSDPYFNERHGLFIRYPVMNAIANEFGLAVAREVDFSLFEAVHALSLALVAEDEDAIAVAKETLAPLLRNLGIGVLSLDKAMDLVDSIAETDYIIAPDAIEEPLIHTNRLGGKRIGLLPNSEGAAFMLAEAPEAEIITFETLEAAFEALEQGEIDAVFAETLVAKSVINISDSSTAILVNRRTLLVQNEYGIAIRIDPEDPDDAEELVELIDNTAENLIIDGTTVELVETWAAVPAPSSVLQVALESMFSNNYSQLYQVVCEVITYDDEMPTPEELEVLDVGKFDFSGLRFETQVNRNGSAAEVSIQGTYSVTIGESTDEYDATSMFDENIPVEMIYDGDNWLFCPEVG